MGGVLGLLLGAGLLLIWRSGPRAPQRRSVTAGWSARRSELLRQAGVESVSSNQLLALQALAGLLALLLVQVVTGTSAVACCFALFAAVAPVAVVRRLRLRRQSALRELWPEAIDNLASAVRAGMSLPEGLAGLGTSGPEPLRPAFGRFAVGYRASGRFGECLNSLKHDLADPVGDRVCETLRVAREVGGTDLGTVLRTLSELLRVDARTRAELETRQGWTVNAARLAVAAPWLVLLLLGSQSSSLRSYDSSGGVLLLGIGGAVCLVAYRVMLHIGRLPEEPRVLR
ncbi:MAG TPA: type II secretion system F family protein [Jatrophihabitans sp.]|nr:type II secretion system F family protein [Jatrophihabitans sp.]